MESKEKKQSFTELDDNLLEQVTGGTMMEEDVPTCNPDEVAKNRLIHWKCSSCSHEFETYAFEGTVSDCAWCHNRTIYRIFKC